VRRELHHRRAARVPRLHVGVLQRAAAAAPAPAAAPHPTRRGRRVRVGSAGKALLPLLAATRPSLITPPPPHLCRCSATASPSSACSARRNR
jgi:hypothetical protein